MLFLPVAALLDELFRDRQAKPGAAVFPGGREIRLGELLEKPAQFFFRDEFSASEESSFVPLVRKLSNVASG